ncbi:MAG: SufD family Fe-S cluster assembly protein [Candidatus Hadarchaeales archaeon]
MKEEPEVKLESYRRKAEPWSKKPLRDLEPEISQRVLESGVRTDEEERAGTYFQADHSVVATSLKSAFEGMVELMSTREALERHEWARNLMWGVLNPSADRFTEFASRDWDNGYFIRVLEGQKVTLPIQACLFLSQENLSQNVHNIIVAEPGSEAQIITGCATHPRVRHGLHIGVSEFYVRKGAKLTFTMIHNWADEFDVRPRTGIIIEDGASFVSNYICLKPVRSLQMYPAAYCRGEESRVSFNSILYGKGGSYMDVGSKVMLQGRNSRGEIISKAVAADESAIYARGLLVGEHSESRAHLECRGLLLSDRARIHAIPELIGSAKGTELSHEAAVGKIAEEQIQYLMARGFTEREAEALIIRGFMDVGIFGLPEKLTRDINEMINRTLESAI